MLKHNENKEQFEERMERVKYSWETILEEQTGIDLGDVYNENFDYSVEIDGEFNMCEFFFAISIIQESLNDMNPVKQIMAAGFLQSMALSLPDGEFEKIVNQNSPPVDGGGSVSFQ